MKVEISIRRAEPEDYLAVYEVHRHEKAIAGTLQLPYPSVAMWRRRLAEPAEGSYNLVAVVDGRIVGMLGLQTFPLRPRRAHAGTIGICVHDDWHGKGVGSALVGAGVEMADRWLNLRRIELEVFADNEAAIRLYERFGFEREGLLRQYAFRDGRYVDAYVMSRLRANTEAT